MKLFNINQTRRRRLVIILYSTLEDNLVFAHQFSIARQLARYFNETIIITAESTPALIDNTFHDIFDLSWNSKGKWRSVFTLLKYFLNLMREKRSETVVFSYMTEVQSAIIAPVTRLFGVPHFLWYAHTNKSPYLKWCHLWLNGIITSTPDSCPYSCSKVKVIGQTIDESLFRYSPRTRTEIRNGLYVGRLDSSKQLENVISLIRIPENSESFSITLVGESTDGNERYLEELKSQNQDLIQEGLLIFAGKIPNSKLPNFMQDFDVFINSFDGSLDKSLIEATFLGLPVVTINIPFLRVFGPWSRAKSESLQTISLQDEYLAVKRMGALDREKICKKRYFNAVENHSRSQWITKLVKILEAS